MLFNVLQVSTNKFNPHLFNDVMLKHIDNVNNVIEVVRAVFAGVECSLAIFVVFVIS